MSSPRGRSRAVVQRGVFGVARGFVWILQLLPARVALRIGDAFGVLYARLQGPRFDVALRNLAIAFPKLTESQRIAIAHRCFRHLGRCIAELALAQGAQRDRLLEGVSVEGLEHLEAAQARSQSGGVLALTAHFGNWELVGAAMAQRGHPLCVVHHGFDNPFFDAWVTNWRRGAGMETLELGRSGLSVMRALGDGRVVAVLLDQNADRDEGLFAPFFSELASTRSGPAQLAASRGIPVVPVFCFRRDVGDGHVVRFAPELELERSSEDADGALLRNVARMNAAIESAIEAAPDQWLWPHKRWKTRPQGEERIYASRRE